MNFVRKSAPHLCAFRLTARQRHPALVAGLCKGICSKFVDYRHFSSLATANSSLRSDSWKRVCAELDDFLEAMNDRSGFDDKHERVQNIEEQMEESGFWKDEKRSDKLLREHSKLKGQIEEHKKLTDAVANGKELYQLADSESDDEMMQECLSELQQLLEDCNERRLILTMTEPDDLKGCYLSVNCGSGGLEAMDWANCLFEMYVNWCKHTEKDFRIINVSKGEVGIQSAVIEIGDECAFGWLKLEEGVHRRCRVSPYGNMRGTMQTAFAGVTLTPLAADGSEDDNSGANVVIRDCDIHVEAFRGTGPGGQHKNTTDSACRIKHLPTGLMVQCVDERSFHANRQNAMMYLRFKLTQMADAKKRAEKRAKYDALDPSTFGNAIRSYKLNPYTLAKDSRSGFEVKAMDKLMDGLLLDDFLKASLTHKFITDSKIL